MIANVVEKAVVTKSDELSTLTQSLPRPAKRRGRRRSLFRPAARLRQRSEYRDAARHSGDGHRNGTLMFARLNS